MTALSSDAIFDRVAPGMRSNAQNQSSSDRLPNVDSHGSPLSRHSFGADTQNSAIGQVAELFDFMSQTFSFSRIGNLVEFWLARGANLALAEPIAHACMRCLPHLDDLSGVLEWEDFCHRAFDNSQGLQQLDQLTDLHDYIVQFTDQAIRLEALGLCLAMIIRAASDIKFFPDVYTYSSQREDLVTFSMQLYDQILDICVALNQPSDLQLILQYENWIVHSYFDGDQSRWIHARSFFDQLLIVCKVLPHGASWGT